jgi:hypothetical protein
MNRFCDSNTKRKIAEKAFCDSAAIRKIAEKALCESTAHRKMPFGQICDSILNRKNHPLHLQCVSESQGVAITSSRCILRRHVAFVAILHSSLPFPFRFLFGKWFNKQYISINQNK